ncbi:MAG TPA: putative 2-aminoethylphosphonate ABC transporter substrate-binding protein [Rhizomicrobium sp.]|nr:putative 2-aminoethylphosphonate ABC transporter substrate-binding protein [Rhizomicrobium sp.]
MLSIRRLGLLALAAAGLAACSPKDQAREQLVVYTAAEADQLPAYQEAFARAHPEIDLVWVRDSTGIVTAKLLAEKRAPRADVVFALAATSMMLLDDQGLLDAYTPKQAARIDARFRDPRQPAHWTGEALWSAALCVNTVEAAKRGLPMPTSWTDLTKPVYRHAITMPDPASSGTGYLAVASWLQIFGEDKGWQFMDALNKNITEYAHSGSKPCKDAARGETPIGISIDFRAAQMKGQGYPIEVVVPSEGVGWDIEATGLVKGTRHAHAAKEFIDWAFSNEAMKLYAKNFPVVGAAQFTRAIPDLPDHYDQRLARIDLTWMAKNRDRIVKTWGNRFDVTN